MGIEIERKWAVRSLPAGLAGGRALRQGYLTTSPTSSVRLRDQAGTLLLTVKLGSGASRSMCMRIEKNSNAVRHGLRG